MDGVGDWRLIESDEDGQAEQPPARAAGQERHEAGRPPMALIAAIVALIVAAAGLAIWATLPTGAAAIDADARTRGAAPLESPIGEPDAVQLAISGAASTSMPSVVVDVEGAVVGPGLHELPADGRVGDAIAAAGGYNVSVDLAAAGQQLNLAQKLVDGMQIRVPVLGQAIGAGPGGSTTASGGQGGSGLIDVNSASAEQLDTLPGIGPVTAAKIIDARQQAPFATIDELESRGAVGASTLAKIRDLVIVGP